MPWKPESGHAPGRTYHSHLPISVLTLGAALAFVLLVGATTFSRPSSVEAAASDYLMCGLRVPNRTQSIRVDHDLSAAGLTEADVLAAMQPWNELFQKYHGFPIFSIATGDPRDADILLTAHGSDRTWVNTPCNPSFVQDGNNRAVVFVGKNDAWRNSVVLAHELGHALGFADFGDAEPAPGHIGYKPCGGYVGVMSYCAAPQSWFMDGELAGLYVDGQLVRDYWSD